ncbi:hypothetical protein [Streptomyces bluensis]|uniref:hypothetical protein n=1 Tax=Streptomyces bluensis TaxID=33897 RepID=UPI00331E7695
MAKLVKAVFVRDPDRHRTVVLHAGEEPEPRLAALVTNADAWEDGKLPAQDADSSGRTSDEDDTDKAAPAAKKTAAKKTAATTRSRGRNAAEQGDSGD